MIRRLLVAAAALALAGAAPAPQPELKLWRLDCGELRGEDLSEYSDTFRQDGRRATLVVSCYLVRHGDDYLLFDTGLSEKALGSGKDTGPALRRTIADQLRQLGLDPRRIGRVAISHYHWDHVGQLAAFPWATLLIGAGDWAAVKAGTAADTSPAAFAHWTSGGGKVDAVRGDRDVFGDGTVRMLDLPGHTPGHHGLLVMLRKGPMLLTGDAAHFAANYATDDVPPFNTSRADSLASLDRLHAIQRNLKATVIIGHDALDVARLPTFPQGAD